MNENVSTEVDSLADSTYTMGRSSEPRGSNDLLASRVDLKMEEGDFRKAVCITCSNDTIAKSSDSTLAVLK